MNAPVAITPITPAEFKTLFKRDKVMHAEVYFLVQRMRPRTGPGNNTFLLVHLNGMWVLWGVEHAGQSIFSYFIPEEDEFMVSNDGATFDQIITSISTEEFYDLFSVPQPEMYHHKLSNKFNARYGPKP